MSVQNFPMYSFRHSDYHPWLLPQPLSDTFRDPSFTSKANSAQDFQDEVWLQRRMELWGEGFSLFDILRLKKPVVRKNTNYDPSVQYNSAAEAQILIYRIPQCEMETNSGISDTDNNPAAELYCTDGS